MLALIQRGTWEGCRPLSADERLAAWAARYYSAGHHRERGKPRIRLTPGESVAATASPAVGNSPRAGRGTDRPALIPARYAFDGIDAADLPDWHPDSLRYAGP